VERLQNDKPLTLVEGESNCWTLWFHSVNALGLPGADTVAKTLLPGHVKDVRELYVVEETDDAGKAFVENVRRRLAEIGWTGTLKVVRCGAKDVSELHLQNPATFKQSWENAVQAAEQVQALYRPEIATVPEPAWLDPPNEAAYHGLADDMVRLIEPHSEADPIALLAQILIFFGNVIGRSAHFRVEGDVHYLNEFLVLLGKTSKGRKGTSSSQVRRPIESVAGAWCNDRIQSGASSSEGLIWTVRDPNWEKRTVKVKGRVVAYEEVEKDAGVADKRLLLFEPEYANVLRQLERQGNTLSTLIRQVWETGNLPASASASTSWDSKKRRSPHGPRRARRGPGTRSPFSSDRGPKRCRRR
jgi:hypothetical protein